MQSLLWRLFPRLGFDTLLDSVFSNADDACVTSLGIQVSSVHFLQPGMNLQSKMGPFALDHLWIYLTKTIGKAGGGCLNSSQKKEVIVHNVPHGARPPVNSLKGQANWSHFEKTQLTAVVLSKGLPWECSLSGIPPSLQDFEKQKSGPHGRENHYPDHWECRVFCQGLACMVAVPMVHGAWHQWDICKYKAVLKFAFSMAPKSMQSVIRACSFASLVLGPAGTGVHQGHRIEMSNHAIFGNISGCH